ncbi:hypothetical protein STRIP9103_01853 [Streptomyces ipomoeae 91-03]|uniref:Uncharacterized protein n=1 Tax=Streptomyces ipomoeae 91-03 TaxID=698759 RepID=L1KWD5_9ACTN|nr:hypothetical protein STRIP9103_01853 [Streptomyces ipomoeae 91-03]
MVAVLCAGRPPPDRFVGGCRRCGSGVPFESGRPPVHGLPGYQRQGTIASGHAPRTGRHGPRTTIGESRSAITPGSLVRLTYVAGSGTRSPPLRRILFGHSLPSPAGETAPPPAVFRKHASSSVR